MREKRADIGLNIKLSNENQFWLKAGSGSQHGSVGGAYVSQSTADGLNRFLQTNQIKPNGAIEDLHLGVDQHDLQFRHSFRANAVNWSWGLERSRDVQDGPFVLFFTPVRLGTVQSFTIDQDDAYVSARYQWDNGNRAQIDLFAQHNRVRRTDNQYVDIYVRPTTPEHLDLQLDQREQNTTEFNPRLGYQWQLADASSLRAVLQKWRRPPRRPRWPRPTRWASR